MFLDIITIVMVDCSSIKFRFCTLFFCVGLLLFPHAYRHAGDISFTVFVILSAGFW